MANCSKQTAVACAAATSVLIACAGAQNQDAELVTDSLEFEPVDAAFNEVDDPIWPVQHGIDPAADRILRNWSDYLAGAPAFTVVLEIAEDVLLNKKDHRQPLPGDNGIQFKAREGTTHPLSLEVEGGVQEMNEQASLYQKTLKDARERDPEVDLVLDTTAEDTNWLRVAR